MRETAAALRRPWHNGFRWTGPWRLYDGEWTRPYVGDNQPGLRHTAVARREAPKRKGARK